MKAKAFDTRLFKRILFHTKPYRGRFAGVVWFSIALSAFAALRPFLLARTVDDYVKNHDKEGLLFYVTLMGIVLLLEVISQFYFVYWANWLGQDLVKDIRIKLFKHMIHFRMRYFDHAPVGQLVTRAVSDIEAIARIFSQGLFMIISDLMKMVVVIVIMIFMNWKLTLIVLAAMPLLVYATRVFQRKMQVTFEEVRNQVSNLNTFVQERVTGMKIVQLFNREKIEADKFSAINQKHKKAWIRTIWYNSIFFPIADIISSVTLGLVVYYAGIRIVGGDEFTTIGQLFSYTMFIGMLFNPLRQIADKFNEMQMGMVAANRVFAVLDTHDHINDSGTLTSDHFHGEIEFRDVYFGYKEGEDVIKGLNLKIQPGQTIAIVGSTGAGKTTIINLLNRFYDIRSGSIAIDGHSINDYQVATLRRQIAVVLQDVFLFADTIYRNITLGNEDITQEQVINAAKAIGVHDFIMSLPGGYEYNVKERGVMLSSGQRQLIAFLRAYVNHPGILILDEATSSVDTYTEELIRKATETITKGRTSIIIAHRLATVVNADKIVVMDKGRIVEEGTHRELLAKPDGMYRNLYESQFLVEEKAE
jgi:ATP-binding cassette subfamily B multidrug efflux pump